VSTDAWTLAVSDADAGALFEVFTTIDEEYAARGFAPKAGFASPLLTRLLFAASTPA